MLITAVLCLSAAVAVAGAGLWLLRRPRPGDPAGSALRAVAPTQLAAAVMLAAGGLVALAGRTGTVVVVVVCVAGAVGTVVAGCWQGAKIALRSGPQPACEHTCGTCLMSCGKGAEGVSVPADVDRMSSQ